MPLNTNQKTALSVAIGAAAALATVGATKLVAHLARYDRDGYDKAGYNKYGYNRDGYNRDGFDANGFDRDGFNKAGYNCWGYNRNGLNKDGYNRQGYNSEGYDKYGYDEDGFNSDGYDRQGYGRDGYNADGLDRAGKNREYYVERIKKLRGAIAEIQEYTKNQQYGVALHDVRRTLEETIKQYIKHFYGESRLEDTIAENIAFCHDKKLISSDLAKKLSIIRQTCNKESHEFDIRDTLTGNEVLNAVAVLTELIGFAEFDWTNHY